MPRGGKRTPKIDPETGQAKKMGRPKSERPTNANVAGRILAQAKAEQLWHTIIDLERRRLGINKDGSLSEVEKKAITGPDYRGNFSIIPLTTVLRYLEDRAYGRPADTVKHIHSKPIDVNVNHNLSDRFRIAMEKAAKRVRDGR